MKDFWAKKIKYYLQKREQLHISPFSPKLPTNGDNAELPNPWRVKDGVNSKLKILGLKTFKITKNMCISPRLW